MMFRLLLLCLSLFSVPIVAVHAIPPPDLILSISQSIMSMVGVLMASLIITVTSLQTYFKNLLLTKKGRFIFYGLCAGIGILSLVFVGLFINDLRLNAWKKSVDTEIRTVWEKYEGVYVAPDEKEARQELSSAAHAVSWPEFLQKADGEEYLVVDIRDKHAFTAGRFEESLHIRLADLLHGRWKELEQYKDTPIYLVCYLGTTGAIAGDFLAAQGFTKLYQPLEGLRPTLARDTDVPFVGKTELLHHEEMINRLSKEETKAAVAAGVKVIDVRSPDHYTQSAAVVADKHMFREYMTLPEIDSFIEDLSQDDSYLALCNSDASCYQGEMLLHDLKEKNMTMIGTYDDTRPSGVKYNFSDGFLVR